ILSKDDAIGIKEVREEMQSNIIDAEYDLIRGSVLTVSNPRSDNPYIRKPQRVLNKDTEIIITGLEERTLPVMVDVNGRVEDLQWDIAQKYPYLDSIDPTNIRLVFGGKQLESDKPLTHYGIMRRSNLVIVTRWWRDSFLFISDELLDPAFDDDFTHVTDDDGKVFKRGGYPYRRPYGWNRIVIKVKGQYENDIWLGAPHHRTESSPGEWPVSYHGTKEIASIKIAEGGYDGDKCNADAKFGKGHYSIPNIDHAATHSDPFEVDGKKYKVVIQNRVNIRNNKIIPKDITGYGADYYVTQSSNDKRPYAVCIKEATF
uniref:Ubiquitin-like domain-containing protein n=1 Tax=Amphimedon queenslandica TaxID=400682 RepID=A0A1X7TNK0_AMPQE